jgi:ferredoxin
MVRITPQPAVRAEGVSGVPVGAKVELTMRIKVDQALCSGHARCFAVAPDVYVINSDGYNEMPETGVSADKQAQALRGARACPEQAITVIDDQNRST